MHYILFYYLVLFSMSTQTKKHSLIKCSGCNDDILYTPKMLIKHASALHDVHSTKEYYDKYILIDENVCFCGNKIESFLSLQKGYASACCRSHSATLHQKNLKADSIKFEKFVNAVRDSVTEQWATKDQSERIEKMSISIRKLVADSSKEELKERHGWMNKLDSASKEKFINDVLLKTGCHNWWATATEEEKSEVYKKRGQTLIKTYEAHGVEIFRKWNATFLRNLKTIPMEDLFSDSDIDAMNDTLSKIFLGKDI